MRRSIAELCGADHHGDPALLAAWLANKTPKVFAGWMRRADASYLVATECGAIAAVGAVTDSGEILLAHDYPVVGPATLPRGIVGTPYQALLTASPLGSEAKWSVISGGLPTGLALDPRSGRISGTPNQPGSSGVTFGVSSGRLPTGVQGYSLVVAN